MSYPRGSYEHRVLSFLQRNRKASLAEMFPVVRIDPTRVKDIVRELVKRGELEEFKPGHFRLGPEAPELAETGNGDDLEAKLLGVLAAKGRATRNVLSSAVGQPPASLTQVLRAMSERGLIDLGGSAWVLTKKGEAQAPRAKAPPEEQESPATAKTRSRRRISPAPTPASPAIKPPSATAPPAPRAPTPVLPAVLPPPRPSAPAPAAPAPPIPAPSSPRPSTAMAPPLRSAPSSQAPAAAAQPAGEWDDGFSFALIPRPAKALVLEEALDLSDLGDEAASRDGWVELRWDAGSRVLAVVPRADRSRHAVRMEGGCVASPHPGRLLGPGAFGVEWDPGAKAFLVSKV